MKPLVRIGLASVVTTLVTAACYWIWSEVGGFLRGTFWNEFRAAVAVVAIFAFLSVLERAWAVAARFFPDPDH